MNASILGYRHGTVINEVANLLVINKDKGFFKIHALIDFKGDVVDFHHIRMCIAKISKKTGVRCSTRIRDNELLVWIRP